MKINTLILTFILALYCLPVTGAEILTIKSKKGQSMIVSLVSKQGDKVVIRRVKDGKEFTISPDSLSEESKKAILAKMKDLKVAYPPLEAKVTIGKRRKTENGSDYMKVMTITSKITLTNKDRKIPCPPCKMNIIFIGQSQSDTDEFYVLSNQEFEVTPTRAGVMLKSAPFVTSYDSDNKGEGNIGGYKYMGYLVTVSDKDGKIIYTKSISGLVNKALQMNVKAAADLKSFSEGTTMDKEMKRL